jgi:hypothetical protein
MTAEIPINRKLQEIVGANEAEDHTHEKGESSPRPIMHYEGFDKLISHSAGLKLAALSGEYIFDPPAISAIGERNHESVRLSKNIHRRSIDPA